MKKLLIIIFLFVFFFSSCETTKKFHIDAKSKLKRNKNEKPKYEIKIKTDKGNYDYGEPIKINIYYTNLSHKDIKIRFGNSQLFDIFIYNKNKELIWNYMRKRKVREEEMEITIPARGKKEHNIKWHQINNQGYFIEKELLNSKFIIYGVRDNEKNIGNSQTSDKAKITIRNSLYDKLNIVKMKLSKEGIKYNYDSFKSYCWYVNTPIVKIDKNNNIASILIPNDVDNNKGIFKKYHYFRSYCEDILSIEKFKK